VDIRERFRGLGASYLIAVLVLAVYGCIFVVRDRTDGSAMAFVVMGTSNTPGNHGYDGQYYYRIAVAPLGATRGLDDAAYRYQRIGYPMLARALSLGRSALVPAMLVLINVAAVALGSLVCAQLLRAHVFPPAYALLWALYAGQAAAFLRDLAEPLAMLLVACALCAVRADRVCLAGVLLALAALTKETALLFAVALAVHYLLRGRGRAFATLTVLAAAPYCAWQAVLARAFGHTGLSGAQTPARLLLDGLRGARGTGALVDDLVVVVVPSVLCVGLLASGIWLRRARGLRGVLGAISSWSSLALALNIAFVWLLPKETYADLWASARTADGLVLAALVHPNFGRCWVRRPLAVAWACSSVFFWWP
jgi:hypothetical protein